MAILSGAIGVNASFIASLSSISQNLSAIARTRTYTAAGFTRAGPCSFVMPAVLPRDALTGARDRSFRRDWYDRIHLLPAAVELGNIVSTVSRAIEVWNAWFTPRTLTELAARDADGLILAGQAGAPLIYGALQTRIYTLTAATQGRPILAASYTFYFDDGSQARLTVTGRRVVVFGFAPNWAGGITERLAWLTDVLESYDGTEQRVRLRAVPRRSFEYQLDLADHEVRILETLLHGWAGRVFAVPVWTDRTVLIAPLAMGALSVTVTNAENADYRTGGLLALWRDNQHHEVMEISSISANTLTLKQALTRAWPAGTKVFPARFARLDGDLTVARPTDALANTRLRFLLEDASNVTAVDAATVYRNYRVLEWSPNRIDDIDTTWRRKLDTLDYGTGLVTNDDLAGQPILLQKLLFYFENRSAIAGFRSWLHARMGRAVPFWLPTFGTDIIVTRNIATADQSVTVQNMGYARYIASPALRRDIVIRTVGGQVYRRRITGATELSDDEEILTLDNALGISLSAVKILRVSFLNLVRLESDAIELFWETDALVRVGFETRTVKDEP
jgi:hypothetical protein